MSSATPLETQKEYYEQWRESGLSKAAFARHRQIETKNFYNWCKNFENKKDKRRPTSVEGINQFVEIKTAPLSNKMLIINTPSGYSIEVP